MIAKEAEGFVYCVSSLGVTGMRNVITTDVGAMVKLVKEASDIPAVIGFGISNPEQAANMAEKQMVSLLVSQLSNWWKNTQRGAFPCGRVCKKHEGCG